MAKVAFKKGLLAALPAAISDGTFYITTDERALYLDIDGTTRVRIGDFQEFATLTALQANTNPSTTALYYVTELNCLAKWDGEKYVQINIDTGATSVEVIGTGNAVTAASYDPATRKLTLTAGATYTTADDVDDQIDAKMAEVTEKIDMLVGEDADKSVRTISTEEAAKAINDFATKVSDDGVVNSFKELVDWVADHGSEAADLTDAITKLQAIVAGIGGEDEKATVVAYVADAIAALSIGDYAKAADLTAAVGRIAALETDSHTHDNKTVLDGVTAAKVTAWDEAEQNAKDYADEALTWGTF